MDDIEICSNQTITRDRIGFEIRMLQNINEIYAKNVLEKKYVNKLYGNVYVTGIDGIELGKSLCQNPNDSTFVIDVAFSIVGVVYYKNMKLAFLTSNMINVNGVTYFQKGNVFALVNDLDINDTKINGMQSPILIARVIAEPNFWPDSNILRVGLICRLERLVDDTKENRDQLNL